MDESQAPSGSQYDVAVIGGGPAGSTAALLLVRAGLRVCVLEKSSHPRFRLGESFLPRCDRFIREELGLADLIDRVPHAPKFGAEFALGDTPSDLTTRFAFDSSLTPGGRTFNVERSLFDAALLEEARRAGVEVRQNEGVRQIVNLDAGDVRLKTDRGTEIRSRWLLDASGQATVVARHLGTRVAASEPHLRKVAYYEHFENVEHLPGGEAGHPLIIMCDEGWFWVIRLSETRTSVGLVLDSAVAQQLDVPADRRLAWGIARCPLLRHRMRNATGPDTNAIVADYSYRCRPYAGPGYFLLGDAGVFMDPIFSTGVCLGMMSAAEAARQITDVEAGRRSQAAARDAYTRYVEGSTGVFFRLIRGYYQHGFRELFLNGTGPYSMHKAVLSILAGHVFPKPAWALRWRLELFYVCLRLQRFVPMVRRRQPFSLRASPADPSRSVLSSLHKTPEPVR